MRRNHHSRFFLLVSIFVAVTSNVLAQTTAITKDFTISLGSKGQAFVTPSDINNGSKSSCGNPTLSIAYVVKTTDTEYTIANLTAPTIGATRNVYTGVYEARYETVANPIIYVNYPSLAGSVPAPAGTYAFIDATNVIESMVLNQSSVTIPVNNSLVGDPYANIVKQLTVTALYAPNLTNQQLSFTAVGTYTVGLIVTDACMNRRSIALAKVTVTPTEVRCGNNGDKYLICHNGHTLCIPASSLAAHLSHGDTAGECSPAIVTIAPDLMVETYPNPASSGQFQIHIKSSYSGATQVNLFDTHGNFISKLFDGQMQAGEERDISVNRPELRQGLYLVRVQNGQKAKSVRVDVKH